MTHNPRTKRMLNLAAVAVAGACLASIPAFAQERGGAGQPQQREDRIGRQTMDQAQKAIDKATLPKGIKWSDEPADVSEVRGVIDDVVGAAVIENGFNDIVERFVDQDRNRFGEWMNEGENREFTQFNASAKKFQEAYKAKFNKEFDFDAETALARLSAVQGEVEDAAVAAANWPAKPFAQGMGGAAQPGDEARVAGAEVGDQQRQPPEGVREQGNIDEGRQVAIVVIPAPSMTSSHDQPAARTAGEAVKDTADKAGDAAEQAADRARDAAQGDRAQGNRAQSPGMAHGMDKGKAVHVSLINEFPGAWKIDVPTNRQPQQVYSDLATCVDKLTAKADSWPSDEAAVQQIVAYELVCAILGGKAEGMDGARPGMNREPARPAGQADRPPTGDGMGGAGGGN